MKNYNLYLKTETPEDPPEDDEEETAQDRTDRDLEIIENS